MIPSLLVFTGEEGLDHKKKNEEYKKQKKNLTLSLPHSR
jgi:hypothetical protein